MSNPWASFFFFNDTATTEIYTLSLHDALPICLFRELLGALLPDTVDRGQPYPKALLRRKIYTCDTCHAILLTRGFTPGDRKSTRLNSSHGYISYAVFCLKKKIKLHDIVYDRVH